MDLHFRDLEGAKSKTMGLLKCPLCGQTFDDPRRLPCGHSFCLKCLQRRFNELQATSSRKLGSFSCASCKHLVGMPSTGVEGFPMDSVGIQKVKQNAVDEMARILLEKLGKRSSNPAADQPEDIRNCGNGGESDEYWENGEETDGYNSFQRGGIYRSERSKYGRPNFRYASLRETRSRRNFFDPQKTFESPLAREHSTSDFKSSSNCEDSGSKFEDCSRNNSRTEPNLQDRQDPSNFLRSDRTRSSFAGLSSVLKDRKCEEFQTSDQTDSSFQLPPMRRSFSLREKMRSRKNLSDIFPQDSTNYDTNSVPDFNNGYPKSRQTGSSSYADSGNANHTASHRATFILPERVLISDDAHPTTTDRTGSSHLPGKGQFFDETDPSCSFTRAADVRKSFRRNRPRAPLFQTFAKTEGDEEVSPSNIRSSTDVTSGIPKFSSNNIPNGHPTDVRDNGRNKQFQTEGHPNQDTPPSGSNKIGGDHDSIEIRNGSASYNSQVSSSHSGETPLNQEDSSPTACHDPKDIVLTYFTDNNFNSDSITTVQVTGDDLPNADVPQTSNFSTESIVGDSCEVQTKYEIVEEEISNAFDFLSESTFDNLAASQKNDEMSTQNEESSEFPNGGQETRSNPDTTCSGTSQLDSVEADVVVTNTRTSLEKSTVDPEFESGLDQSVNRENCDTFEMNRESGDTSNVNLESGDTSETIHDMETVDVGSAESESTTEDSTEFDSSGGLKSDHNRDSGIDVENIVDSSHTDQASEEDNVDPDGISSNSSAKTEGGTKRKKNHHGRKRSFRQEDDRSGKGGNNNNNRGSAKLAHTATEGYAMPTGVVLLSDGRSIVSDYLSGILTFCDAQMETSHRIAGIKPFSVAISPTGNHVIVGDRKRKTICIFDDLGCDIDQWDSNRFGWICGIGVLSNGDLVILDREKSRIGIYRPSGELVLEFGSYGSDDDQLCMGEFLAIDGKDRVIVSDSGNHCIKVFSSQTGELIGKYSGRGSGDGQLQWPKGICVDSRDNIIVADMCNRRVSMFSPAGCFVQHLVTNIGAPYAVSYRSPNEIAVTTHALQYGSQLLMYTI